MASIARRRRSRPFSFTIVCFVTAATLAGARAEETRHRIVDALESFARGSYRDDVTTVVPAVKPQGRR